MGIMYCAGINKDWVKASAAAKEIVPFAAASAVLINAPVLHNVFDVRSTKYTCN